MFIYRHEGNRPFRIETFLSAARSMDATKRKNSQKKRLHTYSRYTVYVNINIYTYKINIYLFIYMCVCMPLRSSYAYLYNSRPLGPPDSHRRRRWTGTCWSSCWVRAPEGGTGQSSPPVPEGSSAPPQPPGLHSPERPPSAGSAGRAAKLGRGVRLGPGMSTTHII